MRVDLTTRYLFSPFFREVGNPRREIVRSLRQFESFVEKNNGFRDCFVSVYSLNLIVDKLFFDFDGSFEEAKKFYRFLIDRGYATIPVFSGKKGIHLYVLLKKRKFSDYNEAKNRVLQAALYLVLEAFGSIPKTLDTHVLGDVKRLTRIPNTLRPPENLSYCTYLPEDFYKMGDEEIILHGKSPHVYEYDLNPTQSIDDFPAPKEKIYEDWWSLDSIPPALQFNIIDGKTFLSRILRPCLYRRIIEDDPPHHVRVATTVDLLNLGLEENTVFKIYSTLGWRDFDPRVTKYQINSCKGLKPYSCRKLRLLRVPLICCWG